MLFATHGIYNRALPGNRLLVGHGSLGGEISASYVNPRAWILQNR
jgi:hypothetical protein